MLEPGLELNLNQKENSLFCLKDTILNFEFIILDFKSKEKKQNVQTRFANRFERTGGY
jgi:hypothetical protein